MSAPQTSQSIFQPPAWTTNRGLSSQQIQALSSKTEDYPAYKYRHYHQHDSCHLLGNTKRDKLWEKSWRLLILIVGGDRDHRLKTQWKQHGSAWPKGDRLCLSDKPSPTLWHKEDLLVVVQWSGRRLFESGLSLLMMHPVWVPVRGAPLTHSSCDTLCFKVVPEPGDQESLSACVVVCTLALFKFHSTLGWRFPAPRYAQ
jgi:hypothetical protein